MKYVALLRGINVGGKSLIKMANLALAIEKAGFQKVSTFIASGNVLFESVTIDQRKMAKIIEETILKTFHITSRVVVLSLKEMQEVVNDSPAVWKDGGEVRKYVAFVIPPMTATAAAEEVPVKPGVDALHVGRNVLYMSTSISALTKSGFTKMIGKKIYQDMTMRNYNTTQKILALMEK